MKENIPGYPGYHVTRDGKVYSCLIQGGSSKRGPWELRYTAITKTGHEQIRLRTPTGFRSKGVHRLVALAYIPNPNSYPIVRHLDDIGTHNTVNNLRKQRRIHRLFSLGYTYKEIGRKVRLSPKVVSRFIRLRNSLD